MLIVTGRGENLDTVYHFCICNNRTAQLSVPAVALSIKIAIAITIVDAIQSQVHQHSLTNTIVYNHRMPAEVLPGDAAWDELYGHSDDDDNDCSEEEEEEGVEHEHEYLSIEATSDDIKSFEKNQNFNWNGGQKKRRTMKNDVEHQVSSEDEEEECVLSVKKKQCCEDESHCIEISFNSNTFTSTMNALSLSNAIIMQIQINADWMKAYTDAETFYEKNGHLNVTRSENPKLLDWMMLQRSYHYLDISIEPRCKQLLDEICFRWDISEAQSFLAYYMEIVKYRHDYSDYDLKGLGNFYSKLEKWTNQIRVKYQEKIYISCSDNNLTDERIALMNDIGFKCLSSKKRHYCLSKNSLELIPRIEMNAIWTKLYNKAKAFFDEHGHLQIPHSENPRLVEWLLCHRYRHYFSKKAIDDDCKRKLDRLNFHWNVLERSPKWTVHYMKLLWHRDLHSDYDLKRLSFFDIKLGQWASSLRLQH